MAKRRKIYEETYKKNVVVLDKQRVIDLINQSDAKLFGVKVGRYDDDTQFLTLTIEDIK